MAKTMKKPTPPVKKPPTPAKRVAHVPQPGGERCRPNAARAGWGRPTGKRPADGLPPKRDEVRYYKKVDSTRGRDIMARVHGCRHSKWSPASGADKAKKGIAHYEGTDDWKTMSHCGSCQGGGMWKVVWRMKKVKE
jgi:hypothetical protein